MVAAHAVVHSIYDYSRGRAVDFVDFEHHADFEQGDLEVEAVEVGGLPRDHPLEIWATQESELCDHTSGPWEFLIFCLWGFGVIVA